MNDVDAARAILAPLIPDSLAAGPAEALDFSQLLDGPVFNRLSHGERALVTMAHAVYTWGPLPIALLGSLDRTNRALVVATLARFCDVADILIDP
jgi:hypothetical protein